VTSIDPLSGHMFDDTRRYIEAAHLTPEQRAQVYAGNARRVYPRLAARLAAGGGAP
jgi:4-oxalmesaconate hydratase